MLSLLKKIFQKEENKSVIREEQHNLEVKKDEEICDFEDDFVLDEKYKFLLHYLHARKKEWKIDEPVKDLFGDIAFAKNQLYRNGYLVEDHHTFFLQCMSVPELRALCKNCGLKTSKNKAELIEDIIEQTTEEERKTICDEEYYVLSPSGLKIDDEYKKKRKQETIDVKRCVENKVREGDYIGATLLKASFYSKMVIPPGIGVDWSDKVRIEESAKNRLMDLRKIDYSDLENTKQYKENLLKALYYDQDIENDLWKSIELFIDDTGEKISCSRIDEFFKKKGYVASEKCKVYFYLDAKRYNLYIDNVNKFSEEASKRQGKMSKGEIGYSKQKKLEPGEYRISDATIEYYKEHDDYVTLSGLNIDGFPKTFGTYQKHKSQNSEKYQMWMKKAKVEKVFLYNR